MLLAALAATAFAQNQRPDNQPFPAFRVMGNIYYVGASDIASYLIVTPAGHILIDTGYEDTPPIIRDGILKLGFKLQDVKILLNSQAHFDHVAGQAEMQRMTGAKIYSSEREVARARKRRQGRPALGPRVHLPGGEGGPRGPRPGGSHSGRRRRWWPISRPATASDAPRGPCASPRAGRSTMWSSSAEPASIRVSSYSATRLSPESRTIMRAHSASCARLPCDVFLGSHGVYYGMAEKYQKLQAGAAVNPFIDPAGYRAYVDRAEKDYLDQLAKEKAAQAGERR